MTRTSSLLAILAVSLGLAGAAHAQGTEEVNTADRNDRLLIVNGNSGRVIYDDGRNDLFCVTRVVVARHDWDGRPVYKRTMRCR